MERYMWSFDGKKYSEAGAFEFRRGERVRMILVNDTMMEHPIHLHLTEFCWFNTCAINPPKGQNVFHYCNPAFDRQERIALGSNVRRVRKDAYARAQRIWAHDVPAIIPWFARRISVHNNDLKLPAGPRGDELLESL
jgi:FtsP/CotA-like multicopper oxidase with cupredoxin domain